MELTTLWTIATWLDFTSYIAHLIHNNIILAIVMVHMSRFCLEFYDHTEMIFVQIVNIGSARMLCNEFLTSPLYLGMIGDC